MSLEPFIAFFLIRYLRKTLKKSSTLPEWDQGMKRAMIAVCVLFVIQIVIPGAEPVIKWIWHLLMFALIAIIFKQPELYSVRTIIFAVLPIVLLSFISDILKFLPRKWFETLQDYLKYIFPFAIIWMIAMFIIFNRQRKALEKERKKTQEEEELNRVIAARKTELEVMVTERTAEITKQKEELQGALNELKTTQTQLIHSEKMASLGELTAGIAHEIQNPLNFVNNFSEVSVELLNEMKTELKNGNTEDAAYITDDIIHNLEKIIHHGKRADSIVKGMLQHSRKSTGQKEPTDINALADEYLRLAFHGLRAKDKSFNAKLHTDFDKNIGKINIVAQDIDRVLLNLYNNAFYAIIEKKNQQPPGNKDYEPTVSVTTKKLANKVEIRVRDNGNGIPQNALDKIFQPFFTTKPTGQGTGLGLSLSYDIIKAHGGEIKVETMENEGLPAGRAGSDFIILLPL